MNGLPYYQRYPRDFFEGTAGMRFELKAAYGLVLDAIYMQGGALPDDARYIAGLLGCSVRKWNSLRKELLDLGKIYAAEGVISNFRADNLLIKSRKYQDKQAENRRGSNKINDLQKPASNHTEPESDITLLQPHADAGVRFMLQPDATLSPAHQHDAVVTGLSAKEAQDEWLKFRDWNRAKQVLFNSGQHVADSWRLWCRRALDRGRPRGGGPGGPGERRNAYSALAEEIGRGIERASQHDAGYAGRGGEQDEDGAGGGVVSFDLRRACG